MTASSGVLAQQAAPSAPPSVVSERPLTAKPPVFSMDAQKAPAEFLLPTYRLYLGGQNGALLTPPTVYRYQQPAVPMVTAPGPMPQTICATRVVPMAPNVDREIYVGGGVPPDIRYTIRGMQGTCVPNPAAAQVSPVTPRVEPAAPTPPSAR
jgi:hypothetical protein